MLLTRSSRNCASTAPSSATKANSLTSRDHFALRGEYVQMQQQRWDIGSETPGGLGFLSVPGIGAKAWNIGATYLLTGEKRPENGTPRVKSPFFGPDTPGGKGRGLGAWEIALRYTGIQANAPGETFFNSLHAGFGSNLRLSTRTRSRSASTGIRTIGSNTW